MCELSKTHHYFSHHLHQNQQDQDGDNQLDGHRRRDSSALESSEDEEKAGGEGYRELRHKPDIKMQRKDKKNGDWLNCAEYQLVI